MMIEKNQLQKSVLLFVVCLFLQLYGQISAQGHRKLDEVIKSARQNIFQSRNQQGFWEQFNYTFGVTRGGQTYLGNRLLGVTEYLDRNEIEKNLRASQLEDGSWHYLADNNLSTGDLSATVLNYLFLKSIGLKDLAQIRAQKYILGHGGIEKVRFDVRFFLALIGSYPWDGFDRIDPSIAVFFFDKSKFARWIGPSFYPMFYLMINRVTLPLARQYPNRYGLDELFLKEIPKTNKQQEYSFKELSLISLKTSLHIIEDKILKGQNREGSWSGYVNSTSLSILALEHYLRHIHELEDRSSVMLELYQAKADQAIFRAYQFQTSTLYSLKYRI